MNGNVLEVFDNKADKSGSNFLDKEKKRGGGEESALYLDQNMQVKVQNENVLPSVF